MRLIYGFDPLCGWCYGFAPAMRAVVAAYPDMPVVLAMPGLVTGPRIGPYAEMEDYIRGASARLQTVTGRAPSEAFFAHIATPGVMGDSHPPIAAIAQVTEAVPEAELAFAHAVCEAHFERGADLNRAETYAEVAGVLGLGLRPDPGDTARAAARMRADADHGIASFPTLIVATGTRAIALPSLYDPRAVVAAVGRARDRLAA
jgi:putative protein-disulfide isomerase